jgi:hypothetical protein
MLQASIGPMLNAPANAQHSIVELPLVGALASGLILVLVLISRSRCGMAT